VLYWVKQQLALMRFKISAKHFSVYLGTQKTVQKPNRNLKQHLLMT